MKTFYNFFKLDAPGKAVISVCTGTACYLKGNDKVLEEFKKELGIGEGESTPDRMFHLQVVRCVGCCGLAPVCVVNGKTYGRVSPNDVRNILDEWRGNGQGDVLKEGGCGFDVLFGGSRMYGNFGGTYQTPYVDKGSYECFWTSTPYMQNDSTELVITRGFSVFNNGILRGTSVQTAAYHVRCVKDAN